MCPLPSATRKSGDRPHHVIRTQGKEEEGTPMSMNPRAFTRLKLMERASGLQVEEG